MSTRIGVIDFPGSTADHSLVALDQCGIEPVRLSPMVTELPDVDGVILPGGASYGNHLRCGAVARFTPVMDDVVRRAGEGLPVLGIGNGFQTLCEAALLPGALTRNESCSRVARNQLVRVESVDTVWTVAFTQDSTPSLPLDSESGRYIADSAVIDALEEHQRIVLRYVGDNPNGSLNDIAGITNDRGNVVGMMLHPELAVDPARGSAAGDAVFQSVKRFARAARFA
jgi:phosphoribosylformylglycinamidine synthase